MKTKINLKKGVLLFTVVSMLIGCNIIAIPLVVNKDVSLGVVNVNGLQDETLYFQELELDLTSFLDDDEINGVESAYLKKVILTLANYKNTDTQSEDFHGFVTFFILKDGLPFNFLTYSQHNQLVTSLSGQVFKNEIPLELLILNEGYDIKSLVKGKKIKIGIVIGGGDHISSAVKLNDAAFSFSAKVETEVQVAL